MQTSQGKTALTQKTLSTTEASILGMLALVGPTSPYELTNRIRRSVGYFWSPAYSHIYAVLPRLVDSSLATRREVVQEKRPNKHVYRITARGRRALREWLRDSPVAPPPDRNPLLVKVFFGHLSEPSVLAEQIRQRGNEMEQLEAELNGIDRRLTASETDRFARLTVKYGLSYAHAVRRWAVEAERQLLEESL